MTDRSNSKQNPSGTDETILNNATYNMIQGQHNLLDSVWHYYTYIEQDYDDDAKEMWKRFKQQQTAQATELRDHLSRRLQHVTGPAGKVGHGPHDSGTQAAGKRSSGDPSAWGQ